MVGVTQEGFLEEKGRKSREDGPGQKACTAGGQESPASGLLGHVLSSDEDCHDWFPSPQNREVVRFRNREVSTAVSSVDVSRGLSMMVARDHRAYNTAGAWGQSLLCETEGSPPPRVTPGSVSQTQRLEPGSCSGTAPLWGLFCGIISGKTFQTHCRHSRFFLLGSESTEASRGAGGQAGLSPSSAKYWMCDLRPRLSQAGPYPLPSGWAWPRHLPRGGKADGEVCVAAGVLAFR